VHYVVFVFLSSNFLRNESKKGTTTKPFEDFFLQKSLKRPYRYAKNEKLKWKFQEKYCNLKLIVI